MRSAFAAVAASLLSAVGCSDVVTTSGPKVDFHVAPTVVQPGDTLTARLAIHNPTGETLELQSGCSSVVMLSILRGGETAPMQGNFGCFTVVTSFEVPPRDSLVQTFTIIALLNEGSPTWRYTLPPTPGDYRIHLAMQVRLPDQDADFRVRE
jgi:hypothetical protein